MDNKQTVKQTKSEEYAVDWKRPYDYQRINIQQLQTVAVVWLDESSVRNNEDYQNTIAQFDYTTNDINAFTNNDRCIEFILDVDHRNVCMIISGSIGQYLLPCIHDIHQLDSIFIYCNNKGHSEQWTKQWSKIRGVFTDLMSICAALRQRTQQCQQNAMSMSFVGSKKRLDQLDPSFMYTQIIKEILLTIDFEDKHFKEFIKYYPDAFGGNKKESYDAEQLLHQYHKETPIWWYTNPQVSLYSMLNCALRMLNGDIIVQMGFFINDLHRHIEQLYKQQFGTIVCGEMFTCYRGQGLSKFDFDEMMKSKGGLMSFNNFLSTSKDRDVPLFFAESNLSNRNLTAILFVIKIDPKQSITPFALIRDISAIPDEDEVLFSMHSVFRIDDVKLIYENNRLFEVSLALTSDNDKELSVLTEQIRKESFPDDDGWMRLGLMLTQLNQNEKAKEIYETLLYESEKDSDKAAIYNQLGLIKLDRGECIEAIEYFEKDLAILQQSLPLGHPHFAKPNDNLGNVYKTMGDYRKALSYYEKALVILQQSIPLNHFDLALSYNSMGVMCEAMGEYSKALLYYDNVLAIRQQLLPSNHPHLASSYSNIGNVYNRMGAYQKALSYYEKALVIRQQSLPSNHRDLAALYNNRGNVYERIGDYRKALSYYEKALAIRQQSLPSNHSDLASSYNSIGNAYCLMSDHPNALSYHEKALAIQEQSLPPNHPDLASSNNNIGNVYNRMGAYRKALSYYKNALVIQQQSLPPNHPYLAASYNNIGSVYNSIGDCSNALSYHEEALAIRQQSLPSNHPDLASSYSNISNVYNTMDDYRKALSYYEKALAIQQQSLPPNHPDLAAFYNNIGVLHENMKNYSKAYSFYERAVQIGEKSLPPNHSFFRRWKNNLEDVKKKL